MADRKEGLLPLPVVAGWYDDMPAGTMARVFYTGEEMDHERLLWPSGRISERGGAHSHWWVRSPDGDVWEEDIKMQKLTMADGGTGSELFPRTGLVFRGP